MKSIIDVFKGAPIIMTFIILAIFLAVYFSPPMKEKRTEISRLERESARLDVELKKYQYTAEESEKAVLEAEHKWNEANKYRKITTGTNNSAFGYQAGISLKPSNEQIPSGPNPDSERK